MSFLGRFAVLLCVVAAAVVGPRSASAAIIAFDDFETYTAGAQLAGQNGGTGWAGAYSTASTQMTVANVGLSYSNGAITIDGGARSASMGNTGSGILDSVFARQFSAAQTGTFYFSMLVRPVAGLDTNDFRQFIVNDDATDHDNALSVGLRTGTPEFGFFARARSTGSVDTTVATGTNAALGTTYLLVGKLSKSASTYDRIDLFLNPSTLTEPGSASATATKDTLSSSLSYITGRTSMIDTGDRFDFDVLRVGTTYQDVLGASAIPEPSSLLLTGAAVGLVGFHRRRNRRKREINAV